MLNRVHRKRRRRACHRKLVGISSAWLPVRAEASGPAVSTGRPRLRRIRFALVSDPIESNVTASMARKWIPIILSTAVLAAILFAQKVAQKPPASLATIQDKNNQTLN